jgi:pilus assembly protein FimV
MQCDNCGYIFFQPSKKCACCSAPYVPAQSAFDVGQENLFTMFEMAAGEGGIPGGTGITETDAGVEDYNFTDDFDAGETEYGVDENVLDLSDAEAEGFGIGAATGAMGVDDFEFDTSGMDGTPSMENAGPDNFDMGLPDDLTDGETASMETLEAEPADDAVDLDFEGGFDEVEGLGFGVDESPPGEAQASDTAEISLDTDLEPEISLEPELDIDDDQPTLELSDESGLDLDMDDDQPSLELSEEPSLELSEEPDLDMGELDTFEEEPSLELSEDFDLAEEPELMDVSEEPELMDVSEEPELTDSPMEESAELEDEGGIEFDLDGVDLDEPEEVAFEVPEAETDDEEPSMDMDFDGLELEMETPDDPDAPEDEELKQ